MCIFKASYVGGKRDGALKYGNVYGVERAAINSEGKAVLILEGVEGEFDKNSFHELEKKGFHYLVSEKIPKVGSCMRLVKRKTDMTEFLTGEVKLVEKSITPGVYTAYTEKAVYEVAAMK